MVSQTPVCGRNHTLPQDHHTVLWLMSICPDNKPKAQSFQRSTRKTMGHCSFIINIPLMSLTNEQYPDQPPQRKLKLRLHSQSRCVEVTLCWADLLPWVGDTLHSALCCLNSSPSALYTLTLSTITFKSTMQLITVHRILAYVLLNVLCARSVIKAPI